MSKIKITEVRYGRTVNVGNFESVRFDLAAEVAANEEWKEVLEELKLLALREEKKIKREGM